LSNAQIIAVNGQYRRLVVNEFKIENLRSKIDPDIEIIRIDIEPYSNPILNLKS